MENHKRPSATVIFIFGGSGDLNFRKLSPALYNLFIDNWMPEKFSIIGIGRTDYSDVDYRTRLLDGIKQFSRRKNVADDQWQSFSQHISYLKMDAEKDEKYTGISELVQKKQTEFGEHPNIIFYMAVAPQLVPDIAKKLGKEKISSDKAYTRIVIEKPFGHDLESAHQLNELLMTMFEEKQIYRIDHYLGKETVQNIMAFRFANSICEPLWNRNYIEHVQISVTEQLGVEERGDYYDGSGALRDMIQNHLLQLLCHVAMEPPVSFNADEVRDRKVDVLRAMRKFSPEDVRNSAVRGQYGSGWMKGKEVPAYRDEPKVDPQSNTETFAAIKFFVDNWRWQGVPFYLRTGKRLHQSSSVITIQFKDVPHLIFPTEAAESWQQNRLIISIQPEMSIRLQVQAKRPGTDMVLNAVDMVFDYKGTYSQQAPEAYETLILDTMLGDQTLFMRGDQVEAAWELVMPILSTWQNKKSLNFPNYSADSWGPESAEALIARDGFNWFTLPVQGKK